MGRDFKEELNWLSHMWEDWSETEQIVALYSVARKLSAVPARFLQLLLLYNCSVDSSMILMAETRANDSAWVSQISDCSEEGTMELLHHFPLLRPANLDAKNRYIKIIHNVLARTLSSSNVSSGHLENARHLLSYTLIHPALAAEERRSFAKWLKVMENRLAQGSETKDGEDCFDKVQQEIREKLEAEGDKFTEKKVFENEDNQIYAPSTAESEQSSEDRSQPLCPRIRDLGTWLKSLRLHKYLSLLSTLEYEELLSLDEETLERKGVTKGARNKIVLSIAKLRDRPKQLDDIEKELLSGGCVMAALNQLKALIITPMPPAQFEEGIEGTESLEDCEKDFRMQQSDLPSQFVRVMGKVCTQLLVSVQPEDDSVSCFLNLIDKCLNHKSFTLIHARRFIYWKQQVLYLWTPILTRARDNRHGRRWSQQYPGEVLSSNIRGGKYNQRFSSISHLLGCVTAGGVLPHIHHPTTGFALPPPLTPLVIPRNASVKGMTLVVNNPLLSPQNFLAKRPSLQETSSQLRPHVTLQRTHSAPSRPHDNSQQSQQSVGLSPAGGSPSDFQVPRPKVLTPDTRQFSSSPERQAQVAETDITDRLESLCLSMTKHALE